MIDKLKEFLKHLQALPEFKSFKKDFPDAYLSSAFFVTDMKEFANLNWQIDFYCPNTKKLTNFLVKNGCLEVTSDQEAFQREKTKIEKLDLDSVSVQLDKALEIVRELIGREYPGETPNMIVVILQTLNGGAVWNITYLLTSLKILNIKVGADDGRILDHKIESVFTFKPPKKA